MLAFRQQCNKLFDLHRAAHATFSFPDALREPARRWLAPQDDGLVEASRRTIALRDIAIAMRENGCEPQLWECIAEKPALIQISKLYGRDWWALGLGRFVEELLHEVEHHASTPWRLKIYSAHDTTLLPVLALFENGAHRGVPDFAADLVLETWLPPQRSQHNEPHVKLKYQGKDVQIIGCEQYGTLCPLSKVREAVGRHIPADLERACGGTLEQRKRHGKKNAEDATGEGTTL